jgi:hypothetical protein
MHRIHWQLAVLYGLVGGLLVILQPQLAAQSQFLSQSPVMDATLFAASGDFSESSSAMPGPATIPLLIPETIQPSMIQPAMIQPAMIQPVIVRTCARPAEALDIDDYNGPLSRLVAGVSQKLDGQTPATDELRRARPCLLSAGDKFRLFIQNSTEPMAFLGAGWEAGWSQHDHHDPSFGQGVHGCFKRYNAAMLSTFSGEFFRTFFFPSVFHQDPRYYRLGSGPIHRRLGHALRHVFVAQSDSGRPMINYSEWMGLASAKALSNVIHPDNERGFGTTAQRVGMNVTSDMAWDVLKEFWPDINRKFHLPFKRHDESLPPAASMQASMN